MHDHSFDGFTHPHVYLGRHHAANERRTLIAVALTAAMMVAEIGGGAIFGSMARLRSSSAAAWSRTPRRGHIHRQRPPEIAAGA
jgi:hypothetical protein